MNAGIEAVVARNREGKRISMNTVTTHSHKDIRERWFPFCPPRSYTYTQY
jgi:hypothetical protein